MSATAQLDPQEDTRAELFESNGRQAVRLPAGLHLDGDSVKVRRVEGGLLLEAPILHRRRTVEEIEAMFKYIDSLDADELFPDGRNQGIAEERDIF